MVGRWCAAPEGAGPTSAPGAFTFIPRPGFPTPTLAYVLDSLVRVSRRVDGHHFASVSEVRFVHADALNEAGAATASRHSFAVPGRGPPRGPAALALVARAVLA